MQIHPLQIDWLDNAIAPLYKAARSQAMRYQDSLTKPRHSLGVLESLAIQFATWQGDYKPCLEQIHISVFAADHGIAAEQVSAFPQAVTAEMVKNFVRGGAAISVLANYSHASLEIIDVGVKDFSPLQGVISQRVANATANFCKQNAMLAVELEHALKAGYDAAERARGNQLFIGGEMGIANTSAATAIACLVLDKAPQQLTGAGTGLDQAGVQHKIAILEKALQRCNTPSHPTTQPLDILLAVGGFEIAALTGAYLHCAQLGIPILVDGFIASVAALLCIRIQADSRQWMLFSHTSAEYGHQKILDAMQAKPILNLNMRLGEASGAAIAIPIIQQALLLQSQMATFAEAGVSNKH
jgi:nicotinate-nucleotide--dimethylbenzimidazole phosphoribosyltransferase